MIKGRVIQVLEKKGIAKEAFYKKIGMTSANFRGKAKETPLNSNAIENILSEIPDLNPVWLITGKGSMLKSYDADDKKRELNETALSYHKESNDPLIQLMQDKIDLLEENKELQAQEIQRLKKELKATKSDQQSTRSKGHVTS